MSDFINSFTFSAILYSLITILLYVVFLNLAKRLLFKDNVDANKTLNNPKFKTIVRIIYSLVKYTLFLVLVLLLFSIWGIDIAPALAGLGLLGFVIGLSAQKFIGDIIAGFLIVFENHFSVGDTVDVNGFTGTVIDFGLRSTKIKHWKGHVKIFSNSHLSPLTNLSKTHSTAIVKFNLSYEADIKIINQKLSKLLIDYYESSNLLNTKPKMLGISNFNSFSFEITVICETIVNQQYQVERELRELILTKLKLKGDDFSYHAHKK